MPKPLRSPLFERLAQAAGKSKRLRFDEFQAIALYDPEHGYFARSAERAGRQGDFLTSPELAPLFAEVLAKVLAEDAAALGAEEFHVVEVGAGRGTLVRDLWRSLRYHPLSRRIRFHLVERSPTAREAMRDVLADVPADRWSAYPDESELGPSKWTTGAVVANELFDNLPVRRVMQGQGLQEILVRVRAGSVREELVPAPVELSAYLEAQRVRLAAGQTAEICLEAPALLARLLSRFERASLLIVDYGDEARHLYDPERFPYGTLAAHRAHATHTDFYSGLGEQDLTAHVNFTPLIETAQAAGLRSLAFSSQGKFLLEHGLPEILDRKVREAKDEFERLKLTTWAKQLYHPEGMGDAFRVFHARTP